jgi:hypothetical protein
MDAKKVEAVQHWPKPKTVKDVQAFLGFVNFYHRFIDKFSCIAKPLAELTKKTDDKRFHWSDSSQRAFDDLKTAFTKEPILAHYDPALPVVVETDASDYVAASILS